MDRAPDLGTEYVVDESVLLDAAQSGKRRAADFGAEVVLGTGGVDDDSLGTWDRILDAALEFLGGWHEFERSGLRRPTTLLGTSR